MADRKVLIKYYPPDFDPEKLAQKGRIYARPPPTKRSRYGKGKLMNVRFMFPFTMCCGMCNEFIYIGTKFNSRVEKIQGDDYLGIPIWRFYARCTNCRAEIIFKTDPKNTEYILESGGVRTYDPRKDAELAGEKLKEQIQEEISLDSMKALEYKTSSTATELQDLEKLDELRRINKRLLCRESTLDQALEWLKRGGLKPSEEAEKEALQIKKDEDEEVEKFKEAQAYRDAARLLGTAPDQITDESDASDSDDALDEADNPPSLVHRLSKTTQSGSARPDDGEPSSSSDIAYKKASQTTSSEGSGQNLPELPLYHENSDNDDDLKGPNNLLALSLRSFPSRAKPQERIQKVPHMIIRRKGVNTHVPLTAATTT